MAEVLMVGSVAFDTLHLPSGDFKKVLGGAAFYASLSAAPFAQARLVAVVGRDYPDQAVAMLKKHGVDMEGLEVAEGETFHWEGKYAEDLRSRSTLATDLNVFANFQPKIPNAYRTSQYVMLGNIDPQLQLAVLDQLEKPAFVLADTMNYWIDSKLPVLQKLFKRIDMLVINEEEARQLAARPSLIEMAEAILAMGPKSVVIKQGEYGAMLFENGLAFSVPAFPLRAVLDPTGAGDSFAGGLIAHLAKSEKTDNNTLRQAIVYGSVMASFCVEGVGSERLAHVDRNRVEERYAAFRELSRF